MTYRIAILGDFNPGYPNHHALNDSSRHVIKLLNNDLQFDWISSDMFNYKTAFDKLYCGLWVAPGSPYKDMQNVINSINFTRRNNIPTFGNCGGFQHMIIEFARNVCGIANADHEETSPDATDLVISELTCSLKEQEEELSIVDKDSLLYRIIKHDKFPGKYFCSYGLNEKYTDILMKNGLSFTSVSSDQHYRTFELKSHPFFLGTLFQPALTSVMEHPNPIITEFVQKSMEYKNIIHIQPQLIIS